MRSESPGDRRMELRSATSTAPRPAAAVADVAQALGDDADVFLAFVPHHYDLDETAEALMRWAGPNVVACTSAGGIGPTGFVPDGFVGITLSGPGTRARTVPITPLSDLGTACAIASARLSTHVANLAGTPAFALLLVDGLSMVEEEITDGLLGILGDGIPVIGGSAADDLRFERTKVLVDGRFESDAATLTLVSSLAPFRPLRVQHHAAGDKILVVTAATPEERLVHALNGRPAAQEYAAAVGVDPAGLSPAVFSAHPLVIRAGGAEWVRSIARAEPDGSLRFFCATERGTVFRNATASDPAEAIERAFADAGEELDPITGALVFDCVLRRLEFEAAGIDAEVAQLLGAYGAAGFNTFGEQYQGVHVNQTMVGIVFGG